MTEDILFGKNVIVQGITGAHGAFHTKAMKLSGTNIVAGTSPGKSGKEIEGIPVYNSIIDIQNDFKIDISIVFVPALYAKGALLEAIAAHIPLVICITEGIPVHDMIDVKQKARKNNVTIIGPNCPGILLPGVQKLGIIPTNMGSVGSIGIVSRSGTLTYEAVAGLTARGVGQKYIIGIGGDSVRGTDFIDCLRLFESDPEVTSIVLIGEIGGSSERTAAKYISSSVTKPVFVYIAGHSAPPGVQLGHAGAILGSNEESATAKTISLQKAGAHTFESIVDLIASVK
jgi:succinyl-CoA synthetase alpha subunit